MESYPCTSCGLCCKIVGLVLEQRDEIKDPLVAKVVKEFPYKTVDGVCEMLQPDNTCAVYETRPDLCNVNTMATLKGVELNEYYKLNAQICNSWIQLNKLDHSFLINLEQFNHAN